ncbi:multidrug resistance-associated protein 1 isoform X1 [Osmerus eperlanus]|uniref:multidrug resistance-associated protein 1 isoform X1 n=1 Tax=Osmerus eperlanus TaxID=29151 RepID=UPI002E167AA3
MCKDCRSRATSSPHSPPQPIVPLLLSTFALVVHPEAQATEREMTFKCPKRTQWNPEQSQTKEWGASFFNRVSYWPVNRLVAAGYRRRLQLSDLCCPGNEDSAKSLCSELEQHWRGDGRSKERSSQESSGEEEEALIGQKPTLVGPALLRHLWVWLRPSLVQVTLLRMTSDLLALLPSQALRWTILFCESQPAFDWSGHTYAVVLLAVVVCHTLVLQVCESHSQMTKLRAHTALTAALYKQALSQSSPAISSLLGDAEQVAALSVLSLPVLFSSVLQGALCVCLLWRELGPSALAGLTVLLLLVPLASTVQHRASAIQKDQQRVRAEREHILREMLNGIRTVKLLVLEEWFHCRVGVTREKELETLRILGYLTAFSLLDRVCVPFLVCVCSFGSYVLVDDGNVLTASQVFTCMCVFPLLHAPVRLLPSLPLRFTQAWNSLHFLNIFLCSQEVSCRGYSEDHVLSANWITKTCVLKDLSYRDDSQALKGPLNTEVTSAPPPNTVTCVRRYLCVCGWGWAGLVVLAQVCVCVWCVCQAGVLALWTAEAKEVQGLEEWRDLRNSRLSLYALLGMLQGVSVCCVALAMNQGSVRASSRLHDNLLTSKLSLPLSFFKTTPTSWVLRNLSQSLYMIEEAFPALLHSWLFGWLQVCVIALLIGYNSMMFSIAVPALTLLFLTLQSYYQRASSQVKQMAADSTTFLSTLFSESHCDDVTATTDHCDYGSDLSRFHGVLDEHLLCRYNSILLDRWLAVWLDVYVGVVLLLVSLALLDSELDPSTVGLCLTYALSLRGILPVLVRSSCEVERSAGVLQSLVEHPNTERESSWSVSCGTPPTWPEEGVLELRNYETEMNPSCARLSFCTRPKEKVGVVSKSATDLEAITTSLFRLVEGREGVVTIDGVDLASLGLHDLRSRLAVIPQSPVLFSGSLRSNLDPWGCHGDAQVWHALEKCHLKERVSRLPRQLLHPLIHGGAGLSSSERRLLCVARALLRGSAVLVYEEPVPPTDSPTDRLLQNLLHTEFSNCTVLTLTRNPWNAMHTDRVLVLQEGRVVEFDSPTTLHLRGALFSRLLSETQTGPAREEEP